jgi:hypothetical protein
MKSSDSRAAAAPLLLQGDARLPKALFVLAAALSLVASVYLWFLVDREQGLFVGLWVPSILSLGALLAGRGERSSE